MIIKRIEKNDIIKVLYDSSTILISHFNSKNKQLNIIFKNGGHYQYNDVSTIDYMRFEIADSNGTIFNQNIKNKYQFIKLPSLSVNEIDNLTKEIISDEEIKLVEEAMINEILLNMNLIIGGYIKTKTVVASELMTLKNSIVQYENILNNKIN